MNRSIPNLAARVAATLTLLLLCGAGPAHAGGWHWTLTPYAWLTDVGADVHVGDRHVVDETIAVTDLLEDLDTIAQIRLEAQRGEHGITIDLFDVTMSDEERGVPLPTGSGSADIDWDMGMTILDVAGLYDPQGDRQSFGFLYGVRVIRERIELDATIAPAPGVEIAQPHEEKDTLVDAMIGVRFTKRFARRWSWQMQSDVSTGGTDFTWSAAPSLAYAFGDSGRYALTAGYRHMVVDFQDDGDVDTRMSLSGALVGFRTSF